MITIMPRISTALALVAALCLAAPAVAAQKPRGENLAPKGQPPVYVHVINPARDVGLHVGDVLQRIVTITVPQPYRLMETSLPLAGTQKTHQGQKQGIETHSAAMEQREDGDYNVYTLDVAYQIFTNNVVAKPAALPPEFVKIGGNGKLFEVRIPSWS